ncbi:MAG TPA: hypothetical protein VD767_05920 [Thermomicrobiales bacterium]|nr:hypothetical protein [Thermomicrobiales bacterium]
MKRNTLLLTIVLALTLGSANVIAAQPTDVDVDGIGESVLAVDAGALVEALEAKPDDSVLPAGFMNPASGIPANEELVNSFALPVSQLEGAVGTVTHGLDTDPSVIPGLVSSGILNYLVYDAEITDDELANFEKSASAGIADDAESGGEGSVQTIDIAGVDAVQIEVITEQSGVVAVVEIVAVPVGNTMVVATVVSADQGEVDEARILELASELSVAGVENLGIVAESAA